MTSNQFEKYLSLLKGFLKFNRKQQEEIATELRDHLEHRIEQLTEDGLSAEEAELIAIQEFGDAAGLASSFLNVSRLNRQRWIMRFTTFAIAGSFVMALFVMSMWPANGPVRLATSQAQENQAGNKAAGYLSGAMQKKKMPSSVFSYAKTRTVAEEKAIEALHSEVEEFEVDDTPLKDTIDQLSKVAGVRIIISQRYLDDAGVDHEAPITLKLNQARLTTILGVILDDQAGLDDWVYGVKDSVIFIAGEETVEQLMEIRVYDCSDFAVPATVTLPTNASFGMGGGGFGGGGMSGGMGVGGGFFSVASKQAAGFAQPQGLGGSGVGGSAPTKIQGATQESGSGSMGAEGDAGGGGMSSMGAPGGGGMSGGMGGGGMGYSGFPTGYKTFQTQDLTELIECIRHTVDVESWDQMGGVATLNQVGTALVVKQSLKNHHRLEELLKMLRKAKNEFKKR